MMITLRVLIMMICFIRPIVSFPQYLRRETHRMSQKCYSTNNSDTTDEPPLYLREGLLAVDKPLGLTSQDVVGRIRRIIEQDAKARGVQDHRKRRRKPWTKVGHGGTLDPLATGVLVIGVGRGTKNLQQYLIGTKAYQAGIELGFQTTTLDLDPKGEIVGREDFDHVSKDLILDILPKFRGNIEQIPPIFSALKKGGKKLYELGREGKTAEDVLIEPRQVQIHALEPVWKEEDDLPKTFGIDVECGGGTYIRSLVRDIGTTLGTLATMTSLQRTKQGVFRLEHCLEENDWTVENICKAIDDSEELLKVHDTAEELQSG